MASSPTFQGHAVEIVDEESHHGDYFQIQPAEPGIAFETPDGNPPWVPAEDLEGIDG